jgi:hypothetical protein
MSRSADRCDFLYPSTPMLPADRPRPKLPSVGDSQASTSIFSLPSSGKGCRP